MQKYSSILQNFLHSRRWNVSKKWLKIENFENDLQLKLQSYEKTFQRKIVHNFKVQSFYLALFAFFSQILPKNGKIRKNGPFSKIPLVTPRNEAYAQ